MTIRPGDLMVSRPVHDRQGACWHVTWEDHTGNLWAACTFRHVHRVALDRDKLTSIRDIDLADRCIRLGCRRAFENEGSHRRLEALAHQHVESEC